jgi:hypothetical protein
MCSKLWPPYGPWTPVAYTSSTKHTWCFCKRKKTLTKSRILGRLASSTASVTCSPSYSLLGWRHSCITWCYPTKVLSSVAVIHDNFRVVQSSVKLLHAQRTSSILLKVDIVKAFDTVNWSFLHDLLHHLSFSRRWINWLSYLLSTASIKIIVNEQTGQRICHARGLRQGDPLSPLLLVLVMEVLNRLFW